MVVTYDEVEIVLLAFFKIVLRAFGGLDEEVRGDGSGIGIAIYCYLNEVYT